MRIINNQVFFYGASEIYSNWHRCTFSMDKITFNCSEQALMYFKAKLFNDNETAFKILKSKNPKEQKELGRLVKNFNQLRWDEVKESIMFQILLEKFKQNSAFKKQILKYKDYQFVEASPYDIIWGIGLGENDDRILNRSNWKGLNLLGNALTKVCNYLSEVK